MLGSIIIIGNAILNPVTPENMNVALWFTIAMIISFVAVWVTIIILDKNDKKDGE